jgi:hypothetical protein
VSGAKARVDSLPHEQAARQRVLYSCLCCGSKRLINHKFLPMWLICGCRSYVPVASERLNEYSPFPLLRYRGNRLHCLLSPNLVREVDGMH